MTPWTVASQTPLSMEFFRQEHWSRLPFPTPGESSQPRDQTCISCVSWIGRQILYHGATSEAPEFKQSITPEKDKTDTCGAYLQSKHRPSWATEEFVTLENNVSKCILLATPVGKASWGSSLASWAYPGTMKDPLSFPPLTSLQVSHP